MRIARKAGLVLLIVGLLLVGYSLYDGFAGRIYQVWQGRQLDRRLDSVLPAPAAPPAPQVTYAKGSAIGRLEIPRLKLSVVVLEGSDTSTLRLGVGRVIHSSLPGEPGNVVLAGHRDTFFRSLREIRPGDQVALRTSQGTFDYTVDWTKVVKPTDTSVIMPTATPSLTLVTCFPFSYIGPAPERFIVRAMPSAGLNAAVAPGAPAKPSPFATPEPPKPMRAAVHAAPPTPRQSVVEPALYDPSTDPPPPASAPSARPAVAPPPPAAPVAMHAATPRPAAKREIAAADDPPPAESAPSAPAPRHGNRAKRAFHRFVKLFSAHHDKIN